MNLAEFICRSIGDFSDKICAPVVENNDASCIALQRGDSEVSCLHVADSAECAIRLDEGEADFGIFNAEELLLAYQFYPHSIQPIFQLRHKERLAGNRKIYTMKLLLVDAISLEYRRMKLLNSIHE